MGHASAGGKQHFYPNDNKNGRLKDDFVEDWQNDENVAFVEMEGIMQIFNPKGDRRFQKTVITSPRHGMYRIKAASTLCMQIRHLNRCLI